MLAVCSSQSGRLGRPPVLALALAFSEVKFLFVLPKCQVSGEMNWSKANISNIGSVGNDWRAHCSGLLWAVTTGGMMAILSLWL